MRVLHINGTSEGGTISLLKDLHQSLLKKKIISFIYTPHNLKLKNSLYPNRRSFNIYSNLILIIKKIIQKFFLKNKESTTFGLFPSFEIDRIIKIVKPDLIHLHWVGNEFLSLKEIENFKIPVVWTMHDLWLINSINHYPNTINKNLSTKLISKIVDYKKKKILKLNSKVIATSNWTFKKLNKKFEFKNKSFLIPCGIDFKKWYPENKKKAKKILGLKDKKTILIIAYGLKNSRKGFSFFIKSMDKIIYDYQLLIVGDQKPEYLENKNFKFIYKPSTYNKRRLIYNAADLIIIPSLYEAFGLVSLEAAACNVPSVIFNNTGLTDIIKHKKTGYIAKYKNYNDLAKGINWIITKLEQDVSIFKTCRKNVIKKFDINNIAKEYIHIYKKLNYQKNIQKINNFNNEKTNL